jgi:hypothetical protein
MKTPIHERNREKGRDICGCVDRAPASSTSRWSQPTCCWTSAARPRIILHTSPPSPRAPAPPNTGVTLGEKSTDCSFRFPGPRYRPATYQASPPPLLEQPGFVAGRRPLSSSAGPAALGPSISASAPPIQSRQAPSPAQPPPSLLPRVGSGRPRPHATWCAPLRQGASLLPGRSRSSAWGEGGVNRGGCCVESVRLVGGLTQAPAGLTFFLSSPQSMVVWLTCAESGQNAEVCHARAAKSGPPAESRVTPSAKRHMPATSQVLARLRPKQEWTGST